MFMDPNLCLMRDKILFLMSGLCSWSELYQYWGNIPGESRGIQPILQVFISKGSSGPGRGLPTRLWRRYSPWGSVSIAILASGFPRVRATWPWEVKVTWDP